MTIKLLKTDCCEPTDQIIKEYKSFDEAEKRYEDLRERAICRVLDKMDLDLEEWLEDEDREEYISLMYEHYEGE